MTFRHVSYRRYWTARVVSLIGMWMQLTALPILLLQRGDSAGVIGLTMAARCLPGLFVLWTGKISDRYDKRKIVLIAEVIDGTACLLLAAAAITGAPMWIIVVLATLSGLPNAIGGPAHQALPTEIAGDHFITQLTGALNFKYSATRLIGPLLAGLLVSTIGIGWCLVISSIGSFYMAATVSTIQLRRHPSKHATTPSLREVIRRPGVRRLLLAFSVFAFAGLQQGVHLPLLVENVGSHGSGFGAVMASLGAGGMVAGAITAAFGPATASRLYLALVIQGATFGFCAFAQSLSTLCLASFAAGIGFIFVHSTVTPLLQQAVGPQNRGTAGGIYLALCIGLSMISSPLIGLLSEHFGIVSSVLLSSGIVITTGLVGLALQAISQVALHVHHAPVEIHVDAVDLDADTSETPALTPERTGLSSQRPQRVHTIFLPQNPAPPLEKSGSSQHLLRTP